MILYIGNKLSKHGYTPTGVETLGGQLAELTTVVTVSDKRNELFRIMDMLCTVVRYRKKVDKVLIDVYSTSNFYFALAAALLCRCYKIPYVPILHGGNLPARLDYSPKLSQMIFKHSLINVAPSGYLEYEFKKRSYTNIILIPNNIDIKDYQFKQRENFSSKLLWVRAFDHTYNCTMAVDVLMLLKKKYPEASLCMVGPDKDGSMKKVREYAASLNLSISTKLNVKTDLIIPGRMAKADWHELSKSYDIFINTTNFDNTPVSVIEAMALGLPVVSTKAGGIPYLIKNSVDGYLIEKENVQAMKEKIELIIEQPPCISQELILKARKKVEAFDWQVVKEKWIEILD